MFGIILVVGGALLLVGRLTDISLGPSAWPLWLIVPGVAMVIGSFAIPPRGGLGLAIPGAILTMLGSVLWVQAATGLYSTWAYAWALVVPTGPGLGMLLYGLVRRDGELARDGLRTTLVGVALFIGFGLFFEGLLSLSGLRVRERSRDPAVRGDRPRRGPGDRLVRRPRGEARRDLRARARPD